jgi:hypothetical protein
MTYAKAEIQEKLKTDQRWLERAIVVLYEYQTSDEQKSEITKWMNGVGFNSPDSRRLSKYAEYINSGKRLSGWHLKKAFSIVPKYAGQILTIINNKNSKQ